MLIDAALLLALVIAVGNRPRHLLTLLGLIAARPAQANLEAAGRFALPACSNNFAMPGFRFCDIAIRNARWGSGRGNQTRVVHCLEPHDLAADSERGMSGFDR